jgi:nicotinate-nucleotide adenylyltransferase
MKREATELTEEALCALRESLADTMSAKRYAHTCAVENMAQRLGVLFCPELVPELRAAALLHDITKEESLQNQLQLCEQFGIMVLDADIHVPKTFHAKTAAARISRDYPAFSTPTVVSAVRWHTTGRANMTLPEQLIYLADYIDDTRKFEDCVTLRAMFWDAHPENMDGEHRLLHLYRVLLCSFDMTIRALLEDGAPISEDTFHARNTLLLQLS